jgi:hypothetical protein
VYERFIAFADRKKGVMDEEIVQFIREEVGQFPQAANQ